MRPGWWALTSTRTTRRASPTTSPSAIAKLLLHRREIDSLYGKVREKGLTLVPRGSTSRTAESKIELALAKGKEQRDKRRDIAKREAERQIERALKARR